MDQPRSIHLPVLRSDGRTDAAARSMHESYEKKEKCGVFGVWGHPGAAGLCYLGLYAQQHRGQESAGIAVTNGKRISGVTGMGLVPEIFDSRVLDELSRSGGRGAIAHNRYSTAGGSLACNAQPLVESYVGGQVALAHNGNIINAELMRTRFEEAGHLFHTTSDTESIVHLLASPAQQKTPDPLASTLRRLQGAFSLLFMSPDRIEAARDPWGWRPLVLGYMPGTDGPSGHAGGYPVVASETVALDVVGAQFVREVEPGEIVTINDQGISSRRFAEPAQRLAHCAFEHVYFANPASIVFGQNVQIVRERLGEKLAEEAPVDADYVVPMPDSGRSAALGFARVSGITYREAIVPNRYVGRTFIKPSQTERQAAVRLKLNIISELVRGKRLIVVDDSIVRGTTTKTKMDQLRHAGASEIHLRISCPSIKHPCYFGVDFATRDQLIAHGRSTEEIRKFLGVDSLHYLTMDGLLACMDRQPRDYCTACWSGDYRLDPEHPEAEMVVDSEQMKIFI
jgi:amidophosphoribosyltransferase